MRHVSILLSLACVVGCAQRQGSSSDMGDAGTSTDDFGMSETGTTDGALPRCAEVDAFDCHAFAHCSPIRGSEASVQPSGEPYCNDLSFPFACAETDCAEGLEGSITLCNDDDPQLMRWVIFRGECLPDGWSLCPDQTC